ncbi:hypothetical protein L484_009232 [Morus notabilis]|uniref:DUF8039 domain-containing protein n=1 Tax=Morus notabilis TaxID=981085 RepID=W9S5S3_9ROSA|nr:hypothetical protein L484_009232 [Morus notabilis]
MVLPNIQQENVAQSGGESCIYHEKVADHTRLKEPSGDSTQSKEQVANPQEKLTKLINVMSRKKEVRLAVENIKNVVAIGEVIDLGGPESVVHGRTMEENTLCVHVYIAIKRNAHLPIQVPDELVTIEDAINYFVARPKDIIIWPDQSTSNGKNPRPVSSNPKRNRV